MMFEVFEAIYPWLLVIIIVTFFLLFIGVIKIVLASQINGSIQVSFFEKRTLILLIFLLIVSVLMEEYRSQYIINKIQIMLKEPAVLIKTDKGTNLNKAQFIKDFSEVSFYKHSGSSPQESNIILIVSPKETLTLNFKRDSREKKLYWIFYPKYPFSGSLGYLKTDAFLTRKTEP